MLRHVRMGLRPPPRSPSNLQISWRRPKSPQLAGSCGWVSVSAETVSGLKAILGGLSLGRGIPFPRCRLILVKTGPDVVRASGAPLSELAEHSDAWDGEVFSQG
jgi:hypothetical protein